MLILLECIAVFTWYFSVFFTDCKYTCHRRCKDEVDLDCTGGWQFERNMSVDEVTMKTLHVINQVTFIETVWFNVQGCSLEKTEQAH